MTSKPGGPGTCSIDEAIFKSRDPPASAFLVLGMHQRILLNIGFLAGRGGARKLDLLKLKLQVIVSCYVSSGNQTWDL